MISIVVHAQIGIGTTTPNASSILDVSSTTKGMLTPRMTTTERTAIVTPANGLIVYDTDLRSFYYYVLPTTSWSPIGAAASGRTNFKRIKAGDNLPVVLGPELAIGGNKYVLNTNTLYEINGAVTFDKPIDLNNAYIQGLDSGEDKITSTGNIFEGNKGGTIKGLTLTAAVNVFSLSGSPTENIIFRDCIVASSGNVGTIANYGLVFFSIVQFVNNTKGITYTTIGQLLLSNLGWFMNNKGTYEKFTGNFDLIQKQGGFSHVINGAIAIDVSGDPLINGDAVMESVVFTGALAGGIYVQPYNTGTYSNYNFNNSWNVRCAGLPNETDADSVGGIAMDYAVGSGAGTTFTGQSNNPTSIKKVEGNSSASNLFRFSTGGMNNRLRYEGKKKRFFQVTGSISFQVEAKGTYIIYVAKNGTPISESKIYGRAGAASDIVVLPINTLVELSNSQYVEVFVQRYSTVNNGDGIVTPNMNITIK